MSFTCQSQEKRVLNGAFLSALLAGVVPVESEMRVLVPRLSVLASKSSLVRWIHLRCTQKMSQLSHDSPNLALRRAQVRIPRHGRFAEPPLEVKVWGRMIPSV